MSLAQLSTILDSAAALTPQDPPGAAAVCTDSGKPGDPCSTAGTCCGVNTGTEICYFNGAGAGACKKEPPLQPGHTWTELYADYFGGAGRASSART